MTSNNKFISLSRVIFMNSMALYAAVVQNPMKYNSFSLLLGKQSYFSIMRLMTSDHRNSKAALGASSVKQERVKASENRASFSREVQERRQGRRSRKERGASLDQGEKMKREFIPWAQIEKIPKVMVSNAGISFPLI